MHKGEYKKILILEYLRPTPPLGQRLLLTRQLLLDGARGNFSLAFYRRNLAFTPWNLAWNSFYTVEIPNLFVCRLNSPPIDQSFSSVLRPK